MILKPKIGYALFKTIEILKIKQKAFVLLLIKRPHFFETPGTCLGCDVDKVNQKPMTSYVTESKFISSVLIKVY